MSKGAAREEQKDSIDFEAALDELETLVQRLERGELSLEESLSQFERGIDLSRRCQKALAEAQQKVEILIERAGGDETAPFEPDA